MKKTDREVRPPAQLPSLRSGSAPVLGAPLIATTAALANAAWLVPGADAQTTPKPEMMPEVVVRGQQETGSPYNPEAVQNPLFTEPLLNVPQTVTIVPQAVIEDQNATTLRDALRNVPGISIQAGEGGGGPGGDFLSIRGFNARNDVYIDNIRDFGGYSRDMFNTEQVEVIKGPSSTYTGRGSTGGYINLVSKTPVLDDSFYRGTAGFGTEYYKRFTIDVNQRLTPIWKRRPAANPDAKELAEVVDADPFFRMSLRLTAMFNDADVSNRNQVEYRRWGIAPSLALGFGDDAKLTLSYYHLAQDNVPDYGIPWVPITQKVLSPKYWNKPPPVNFDNFYGLLDRDFEKLTTDLFTLQYEQRVDEWFVARNIARYGQTQRDSVTTAPRFSPDVTDPSEVILRQFQSRDQTDSIISDLFDMRFNFETFGVKHELVTGVDFAYETAENRLRIAPLAPPADLYRPNPFDKFRGQITYTGGFNESASTDVGLFMGETMKFWDERILLSGGVRWDYYDAELTQRIAPAVSDDPFVTNNFRRIDRVWSYRVALAVKPVKIGTIYFAYGTSFNPSAEGAVSLQPLTSATAMLEPEQNRTFELGTKWDLFKERLSLTAALFRIDKTNARTPGLTPEDPPTVLEGEQRVQGYEIGIAGNITKEWSIFGGYTYLHSEILKTNAFTTNPITGKMVSQKGNSLPQTPAHSFSLWTTYALPWGIEIGGGVQYVGARYSSADNLRQAPGYWLFDAMISKEITRNVKIQLNVYNLANEEYIDRVGGGHFIPGAGRTAVVTLAFDF